MKFPLVSDIMTRDIISIDINSSMSEAIDKILQYEHRSIIVLDGNDYYMLGIVDILNLQTQSFGMNTKLTEVKLPKIPSINRHKNVLDTLELVGDGIEFICVLDDDNSLYGLLTHTDITSNIDPDTLMDNYKLEDFIKLGRMMKLVSEDEKISSLIGGMVMEHYDNVIVVDDLKPIGILTTKDIMYLIKNQHDLDVPIGKHMTSPVDTIDKSASIKDALNFAKDKKYKRVVVVDNDGKLSGIVSQKELISLTYSRWAMLMKEYQEELSEINSMLENKNREFELMASTDALTGLYNRHKFSELYVTSYKSMVQRHNQMSVIMLDIDNFKKVNDTYGHNIGDKVIVQTAHSLLRNLRNIDIVCRWGGEEFVALLPTASLQTAQELAQKIRKHIADLDVEIVGDISASFGVAEIREGEDMVDVIARADEALYLAKNSGKNCVKSEEDLNPEN